MALFRASTPLAGQTRMGATLSVARAALQYTPGKAHNHQPCGRWDLIKANPNSDFLVNRAVASSSKPYEVVNWALTREFDDKPTGKKHLYWYIFAGRGADYVEDAVIDTALRQDDGLRRRLKSELQARGSTGVIKAHVEISQQDYGSGVGQDIRFAWGAIDRFDFEADFTAGTFRAWFQDRYEWHPVYPGLYQQFDDDEPRPTNGVHAALVELKTEGAADYWMKGEATVPLSAILSVPPSSIWDTPPGLGLEGEGDL